MAAKPQPQEPDSPEHRLQRAAQELGCSLSAGQGGQLLAYLALIGRWNKVYNLTAVRDPHEMLTLHLLDSLAVLAPLRRSMGQPLPAGQARTLRLLDVGSGAGLPGVVIAICCPDVDVTCVDAVAKKTAFIQQVAATLKLPNLHAVHARVETLAGPFDVVCSRAFSSLADFVAGSAQALSDGGVWLAMKGKVPTDELAALPASVELFHVEPTPVPGLQADRCIVWMRRK
ncbi:MAG: 16S rRNA (guanine(527)-N(7))-methyltransferase RsmG [Betaproteobacteria bacterium]